MSLIFCFLLCLLVATLQPTLAASVPLVAFAPFLILCMQKKALLFSLWMGALSGLLIDLLTSQHRFGTYSVSYVLSLLLVRKLQRRSAGDRPLGLALLSGIASLIAILVQLPVVLYLDGSVRVSAQAAFALSCKAFLFGSLYAMGVYLLLSLRKRTPIARRF